MVALERFQDSGSPAIRALRRQGMVAPRLALELFDDTPAAELLQIIDAARWEGGTMLWQLASEWKGDGAVWEGTALQLENLLTSNSTASHEAIRLLKHCKLDRLLSRLKEDEPDRVMQHRTRTQRRWRVAAPAG